MFSAPYYGLKIRELRLCSTPYLAAQTVKDVGDRVVYTRGYLNIKEKHWFWPSYSTEDFINLTWEKDEKKI